MGANGTIDVPGRYEICVRGTFGETLADELGARSVDLGRGKTALIVEVVDQAQLHGVIERLRDLNIEIERINTV